MLNWKKNTHKLFENNFHFRLVPLDVSLHLGVILLLDTAKCDILYVQLHHPNREDLSVFEGGRVVQTAGKGSPLE